MTSQHPETYPPALRTIAAPPIDVWPANGPHDGVTPFEIPRRSHAIVRTLRVLEVGKSSD
jgi:hypothetical protein